MSEINSKTEKACRLTGWGYVKTRKTIAITLRLDGLLIPEAHVDNIMGEVYTREPLYAGHKPAAHPFYAARWEGVYVSSLVDLMDAYDVVVVRKKKTVA